MVHLTPALTPPADLAPELLAILQAELAAGNAIADIIPGGDVRGSLTVLLEQPFRTPLQPATANLRFRQVNLPGWWSAEYTTAVPPHTLACRGDDFPSNTTP